MIKVDFYGAGAPKIIPKIKTTEEFNYEKGLC